jgi:hypothetical protein
MRPSEYSQSSTSAHAAHVLGRPRAGRSGDRDAAPPDEGCACCARPRRTHRAPRRYRCSDGGGRKRIPRPKHARRAPDRAWRGALRSTCRALQASTALVVDACRHVVDSLRSVSLAGCPVLFARALGEPWPGDVPRDMLVARAFGAKPADRSYPARLRVEVVRLRALAGVSATMEGFALVPLHAGEVVVLAMPVKEEHATMLALLAGGEARSSSALALALGTSRRTVQRALDSLAASGKVSLGRGQDLRWMTSPLPGFTTTLLLLAPLPSD